MILWSWKPDPNDTGVPAVLLDLLLEGTTPLVGINHPD
jgi:hypothetical protein